LEAKLEAGQAPNLSGSVMFYRQPEPLSLEKHRSLGARRTERPFAFLRGAHVVPLTVNEFGMAAGVYPIIFAGAEKVPLAVMGARAGENLFVDSQDQPEPDAYLPAFVRRYPFVFAAADGSDQLIVCIDRAAPMIGENPDVPFFDGDQPSKYTQEAIEFCTEFERQRRATEEFVKLVTELDLFEVKSVTFNQRDADGQEQSQKIADYFAIDEAKLAALPADKLVQLRDQGALGVIYAHLISLMNWPRIVQKTLRRAAGEQPVN
jgi:hypothetical protein